MHGLLGPNGAGKTTLMRVLATALPPTSGRVRLLPRDPDRPKRGDLRWVRRRLGYLPQSFGFYPRFTAREFVEYLAWLKEVPADRVSLAVDTALRRVGLGDRADEKLKHLSGGMVRRVGIAQAIVNDPAVLLLDEPTAGLDPEQRVEFRSLLRELGTDTCVLISTHLVEDVASACTRVMLLDGGRIVFAGSPDDLAGQGAGHPGDSPIERGYTAALHAGRPERG